MTPFGQSFRETVRRFDGLPASIREDSARAALAYLREREALTGTLQAEAQRTLAPYGGDELLGQKDF
jgi:hypothetical protein